MRTHGTRHDFDRVARAVVSGRRGLGARGDRLADAVARRLRSKLEAIGVPGAHRVPKWRSPHPQDTGAVLAVLVRADKHLADAAMKSVHGSAYPR